MAKKKKNPSRKSGNYGINIFSVVPMRVAPSDKEEMVSQILFGECFEILSKRGKNWIKVRCHLDDYVGWIDPKMICRIDAEEFEKYTKDVSFALGLSHAVMSDQASFPVLIGSSLPNFDGISLSMPDNKLVYNGQVIKLENPIEDGGMLVRIAMKYLHAPYIWGGRSPFGIDCSGLTQVVFKMCKIWLPRDAKDQMHLGETVDFLDQCEPGDLAFFDNLKGDIIHVGIVVEAGKILHASGSVRVDRLDHQGIYNVDTKKYSHTLRIVKRLL